MENVALHYVFFFYSIFPHNFTNIFLALLFFLIMAMFNLIAWPLVQFSNNWRKYSHTAKQYWRSSQTTIKKWTKEKRKKTQSHFFLLYWIRITRSMISEYSSCSVTITLIIIIFVHVQIYAHERPPSVHLKSVKYTK